MTDCDNIPDLLIPVNTAITQMLKTVSTQLKTETISITAALGRVLAQDVNATINVPPTNNSAMDGYALNYGDLQVATAHCLPISQRICAGEVGTALAEGTAVRIFTGAPIPPNVDTVIMQEFCQQTSLTNGDYSQQVCVDARHAIIGANIRPAGEDIGKGDTILHQGQTLRPQDLGLAASIGLAEVTVFKRLKVAIFSTGNELREPNETLKAGQIYNSNRYTLRSMLESIGCKLLDLGIVEDTLAATKAAMLEAVQQADMLMTSGGVSVGEEDYIRVALEELGQLNLWRINIKPGKPLAFGHIDETPFIGLPGNPVSVFATFCILARPYLQKLQGKTKCHTTTFDIPVDFDFEKAASREEYFRVSLRENTQGIQVLQRYSHQGSGVLSSTTWADGLACIPVNTVVKKGDRLKFYPFSELFSC
jgi:molybdopterin molybdotransferase